MLRDVSFRVAPGQSIAIVGHTGAGKTTLISLLLRFYDVQRGQILLDGVDIRRLDLAELRRNFGIVLQDPFLFTGTIESNVRLGTAGIDRYAVERAVDEIGLGAFVRSLPEGVATPVNERGSTLSVGQRQLISFARALAHDPKALVLDEPTANLAPKIATEVLETIKSFASDLGLAVVLVEQNARRALEIGDRAYLLVGGKKVFGNAAAFNCAPNHRERIGLTWRISGPCHPRFRGARVFALHHNEQVVYIFRFKPPCIGQYRLAVRNFHGHKLISYASFYLRVHG